MQAAGSTRIVLRTSRSPDHAGLLAPCTAATSSSSATCVPYDQVSLFTFPTMCSRTPWSADTDCSTSTSPTIVPYTTPTTGATWSAPIGEHDGHLPAHRLPSEQLDFDQQCGWSFEQFLDARQCLRRTDRKSCAGLDSVGGDGTYYAGAIYAAQSSLMAAQAAAPGSQERHDHPQRR